jgi:hypothetical protein
MVSKPGLDVSYAEAVGTRKWLNLDKSISKKMELQPTNCILHKGAGLGVVVLEDQG